MVIESPIPTTPMQRAFIASATRHSELGCELLQVVLRFDHPIDAPRLFSALSQTAARHPALRAAVVEDGAGGHVMRIGDEIRVPERTGWVPELDSGLAAYLERDRRAGLSLAHAPSWRMMLLSESAERHALILTFHHALLDGRSLALVVAEILRRFDGRTVSDQEERAFLAHAAQGPHAIEPPEAEAYFREHLAGHEPALLPRGVDARSGQTATRREQVRRLGPDATRRLHAVAEASQAATVATLVQAGWALLVARYVRRDDVVIGTVRAGRHGTVPGAAEAVGLFINTLPLRTRIRRAQPLGAWLTELRNIQVAHRPFTHVPLPRVLDWTEHPGESLFDGALVYERGDLESLVRALDPEAVEPGGPGRGKRSISLHERSGAPLTVAVYDGDDLSVHIEHDADAFCPAMIQRMALHLVGLLEAFGRLDLSTPVGEIELLGPEEQAYLHRLSRPRRPTDGRQGELSSSIRGGAEDATVLVDAEGRRLDRAGLDARVGAFAAELERRGVGPGHVVGVHLGRSVDLVASWLAILWRGAAFLPLDPAYPPKRLRLMVEDSGCRVVISEEQAALPWTDRSVVRPAAVIDGGPVDPIAVPPDATAYVIYTSGSTGQPKGVSIIRRALFAHSDAVIDAYALSASDVVLQFASPSFDISIEEVFPTLRAGARLVLRGDAMGLDVGELMRFVDREGVTVLNLPTAFFNELVRWLDERPGARVPPAVRLQIVGGEAADPAAYGRWRNHVGERVRWMNAYGPTEATVTSTVYEAHGDEGGKLSIPIGRPLGHAEVEVRDPHGRKVPFGIPGELVIGGPGVSPGYLGRPELTARAFEDAGRGGRWYRTGDLVRFDEEGQLRFLGRIDDQVKVRGFRIEPGEVETQIAGLPGVTSCAVVVAHPQTSAASLAAFVVVAAADAPRNVNDLLDALRARLPGYMVPSRFEIVDRLPTSVGGKLDRKALSARAESVEAEADLEDCGLSSTEGRVARIWAAALGAGRIGRKDDFFDLGGHSLLLLRVLARVRAELGVDLSPGAVLGRTRLADFAAQVDERLDRGPGAWPHPAEPSEAEATEIRPSIFQEEMWFREQASGGRGVYNVPVRLRLAGELDLRRLTRALRTIMDRHDVLRSVFIMEGDDLQVRVGSAVEPDLVVAEPSGDPDTFVRAELRSMLGQSFDLETEPGLRFELIRRGPKDHLLLVVMHHIYADEWSIQLLEEELPQVYARLEQGMDPEELIPPSRFSYYTFAARHRARLEANRERWLDEWESLLRPALEPLNLRPVRPRPPRQTFRGGWTETTLANDIHARIKTLAREEGVSPMVVGMAAFHGLLTRYADQEDVVSATAVSLRTEEDLQDVFGLLINTVPVATRFDEACTFAGALARTRDAIAHGLNSSSLPFGDIVKRLLPSRDPSRPPLAQVFFTWVDHLPTQRTHGSIAVTSEPVDTTTAKFELSLFVTPGPAGLRVGLEYNCDLFDGGFAEHFLRHYVRFLEQGLLAPATPIANIPYLSPPEREHLAVRDAGTDRPDLLELDVLGMFHQRVRARPESPAVVSQYEIAVETYAQLSARAASVAVALKDRGIEPGDRVAVLMPRSLALPGVLFGIMEAGATYVPLDVAHPEARLRQTLESASPQAVVTVSGGRHWVPDEGEVSLLFADAIEIDPSARARHRPDPGDAAYVIFTSGSTGRPKGVVVPHRAFGNFLGAMREQPGFSAEDRIVFTTTPSFDIAGLEVFLPLVSGGVVDILAESSEDPKVLRQQLSANMSVTTFQATPSGMRMLLDSGWLPRPNLTLLCGGEALPRELADRLTSTRAPLYNMYGPTETTVWSTFGKVGPGNIDVGQPIANTRVYILDRWGQLVPDGVEGELVIGGEGVTAGYLGQPELTASKFVPDRFRGQGHMYHTGDRAVRTRSGPIEVMGRMDGQVKIRGYRIELGDVESALVACEGVREAACLARKTPVGLDELIGYFVPEREAVTREAVSAELRERLPSYMVPARLVPIDAMPRTGNKKIDRKALPEPEGIISEEPRAAAPPRDDLEVLVVRVMSRLLGTESIGLDVSFFEAGGHSLSAVLLARDLGQAAGFELPLSAIFENPTPRQLADRIRNSGGVLAETTVLSLNGVVNEEVPLFCLLGVHIYQDLARHILDRPAYGVYVPNEWKLVEGAGGDPSRGRFDALVDAYVEAISERRPRGPYHLLGISFAGLLAFEVACRLRDRGDEVQMVGVLDTVLPWAVERSVLGLATAQPRLIRREGLGYVRRITDRAWSKFRGRPDIAGGPGPRELVGAEAEQRALRANRQDLFLDLMDAYEPREPVELDVNLVRCLDQSTFEDYGYTVAPDLGWGRIVGTSLRLLVADTDHLGVLKPPAVDRVARDLAVWMRGYE